MNESQITALPNIMNIMGSTSKNFTISGFKELSETWDHARKIHVSQFVKETISVKYKNKELGFDVYFWPLWEWCKELLVDKILAPQFQWDAQRLYKCTGGNCSTIPHGAKPFCIIFYADKTRLSSFGTEKGYPVVARCANLPVSIRNGNGVGRGRLIGWLPIPEEDPKESGKKNYVNLKHHILDEIKKTLTDLSSRDAWEAFGEIDEGLQGIPPWSGLNHFSSLKGSEFTDGTKYEDLSKV
ncbi:hypothetical protein NLJ89_g10110 [Agrocybe chaxingu]|uniref:Uncharacterized protein n=1 Tax=Agrocybe chaxingu TaxID=84603 RepID=A0A9W8JR74_9AGAR|nr:hypothetical protein NLJ89_g10110 [Agrocybe chaxingu]